MPAVVSSTHASDRDPATARAGSERTCACFGMGKDHSDGLSMVAFKAFAPIL